jgi:PTH1 family peptidyl-tRNA hydrolase
LLVICDDLNIPFGTVRVKTKGSNGGHNGLKDLESKLGTNNYARLRFGIKNETKKTTTQFVLDKWNKKELDVLETYFKKIEDAVFSYTLLGPSITMNNYNN